jgi:transmembrane sensor
MALDPQYWKRISRYLADDMGEEEKSVFEKWIQESPENKHIVEEAAHIWRSSTVKFRLNDETDSLWLQLLARIERKQSKPKLLVFLEKNRSWLSVAATLVFLSGIAAIVFWPETSEVEKISAVVNDDITVTSGNEVATIFLPDSTKVWLNVNSKLSYPRDYGKVSRVTKLAGEGYFMVTRNEKIPFAVNMKKATVNVLGTTFNVKEDSSAVTLTVAKGSVMFESSPENRIMVKEKEKAVLTEGEPIKKVKNTDQAFASWRLENNPIFENEKKQPLTYLSNTYTWHKNQINQSVIEGTIKNSATLASFRNLVLKVTYTKGNGKTATVDVTIDEVVEAGKSIHYKRRLLDILTNTKSVKAKLQSAVIVKPIL